METKWCTNNLCNNATATWNETQINSLGWNSHEYLLKKMKMNLMFYSTSKFCEMNLLNLSLNNEENMETLKAQEAGCGFLE